MGGWLAGGWVGGWAVSWLVGSRQVDSWMFGLVMVAWLKSVPRVGGVIKKGRLFEVFDAAKL